MSIELEWPITVRPYDIDFAGMVNNQVYFRWLEDMRTEIWSRVISLEETAALGYVPVLLESHIEYKLPLRLNDRPVGYMHITAIGMVRLTMEAEFRVGETIYAKAWHKLAVVDSKTLRPVKIPSTLLQALTGVDSK